MTQVGLGRDSPDLPESARVTLSGAYTRIGLLDHAGYGNLGDEATLAALTHNIKSRWPQAQIVGLTLNPYDTRKRHGIVSYAIQRNCKLPPPPPVPENSQTTPGVRLKAVLRGYPILNLVLRAVKAVTIRVPRAFFQELLFLVESFRIATSLDLLIVAGNGELRASWDGPWNFP
jgi:polysaccharide pyruvyl transferase WcaK-like protein